MEQQTRSLQAPAPHSPAALARAVLAATLTGVLLLGVASLGPRIAATHAAMDASPLRATDERLARVYLADPATHTIRVLNVRSGVSEIARVPIPRGSAVRSIRLDGSGNWLFVDTDAGRFGMATQRLEMEPELPQVARQSEPLASPRTN